MLTRGPWARLVRGRCGAWGGAAVGAGLLLAMSGPCAAQTSGTRGNAGGASSNPQGGPEDKPRAGVSEVPLPMREFRGVWVATVANIDWPSKPGLSVEQLRREMKILLDTAGSCHLNAVLLQVRPSCDAMYPSKLEPWSEFLSGRSGTPPAGDATYDPLAEWVEAAHVRGLELHAWINPFRARHIKATAPDAANHISRTRPDLVRAYDGYLWLDPGESDARAHSLSVATDLATRYDIDGLHIDDYFYPYPKKDQPFPDDRAYEAYRVAQVAKGTPLERADWRRENINTFVRELVSRVRAVKPQLRVGVSPFGIWRPSHPPQVKGFDAYEGLSADARLWLREGWVDYVAPQLYWKLDAKEQPFARLLDWWLDQRGGGVQERPVWPGLYATRINDTKETWEASEILGQIAATRERTGSPAASAAGARAPGVVLYSAIGLLQNRKGLATSLRGGVFGQPALVPEAPWLAPRVEGRELGVGPVSLTVNVVAGAPAGSSGAEGVGPEWEIEIVFAPAPTLVATAEAVRSVYWTRIAGTGEVWSWHATSPGSGARGSVRLGRNIPPAEGSSGGPIVEVAMAYMDRAGRLGPIARAAVPGAKP